MPKAKARGRDKKVHMRKGTTVAWPPGEGRLNNPTRPHRQLPKHPEKAADVLRRSECATHWATDCSPEVLGRYWWNSSGGTEQFPFRKVFFGPACHGPLTVAASDTTRDHSDTSWAACVHDAAFIPE